MTTQEAYEGIREFFSREGAALAKERNTDEGFTRCFYRGDADRSSSVRCAVGCLIPDELYKPRWESKSISALLGTWGKRDEYDPDLGAFFEGVEDRFLEAAQGAHDAAGDASGFIEALDVIAREHDLQVA